MDRLIDLDLAEAACCFAVCMFAWLLVGGPGLVFLLLEFILKELDEW